MKQSWTPQQNNAITARNRNILVSAAAGSGKTSVLVERVIRMISDDSSGIDIDKLLVVTFTNAAAAEMKHRISKAISDIIRKDPSDKNARRQLSLLSNAKITTIDSFCISLVRENFYQLGINRDFKTLEDSELQIVQDEIISDLLNEYFDGGNAEFKKLLDAYTTPSSDKQLISLIKRILTFIYAQPFPFVWFKQMIELYDENEDFTDSEWFAYVKNELDYLYKTATDKVNENVSLLKELGTDDEKVIDKFTNLIYDDLAVVNKYANSDLNDWDALCTGAKPSFLKAPSSSKIDSAVAFRLKANRELYKDIVTNKSREFFVSTVDEYKDDVREIHSLLCVLYDFVNEADERLLEYKKSVNAYTFSDIEHFAINLLMKVDENGDICRTELADKLSEAYCEILVDEYQDTNEAQDLLFRCLSNGKNLFVVGDVKQSIYRFRLAMPFVFTRKRKSYTPYDENDNSDSSTIILDQNFRSKKDICSYVNFIFSSVMTEKVGELDYKDEDYLHFGASYYIDNPVPAAQLKIIDGTGEFKSNIAEAIYIAQTINEKVNSKELIQEGDSLRPVRYGDFAILMRNLRSNVTEYSEILTSYGIPVICDNSSNLFENSEIKIIISLLRAINNPTLEIPLLATMISPIYAFSDDELAEIRIENKYSSFYQCVSTSENKKAIAFLEDLSDLRDISVTMSVAGFIRYLVETKGIVAFTNAMGNAEQRYQNIIKFISLAENFDNGSNIGLTSFLRYIDSIISSESGVESASLNSGNENAVKIMSVHRSKGLEFPIVILAGAAKQYNTRDLSERVLLNTGYGFGVKGFENSRMFTYPTVPYTVIHNVNSYELMSENLRVLYVAMTRAKEQFISFITLSNLERRLNGAAAKLDGSSLNSFCVKNATNDADLLLACALMHKDGKKLRSLLSGDFIKIKDSDFSLKIDIIKGDELQEADYTEEKAAPNELIVEQIANKLEYSYERESLSTLAPKLVASSLDDTEQGFEYLTSAKPAFLNKSGLTPAQRGTAMHEFMHYCDYSAARASVQSEIQRLVKNSYLTEEQGNSLDVQRLEGFFKSELCDRMFNSNRIYREFKTSTFLKASEIYNTEFDDDVLVQGIADCVFEENGELVLIDYKTDRVENCDELIDRYKNQIEFYITSVSRTLKMPVKEAYLYSFYLNKICKYK